MNNKLKRKFVLILSILYRVPHHPDKEPKKIYHRNKLQGFIKKNSQK